MSVSAEQRVGPSSRGRSAYIISARYDWALFLGPPLLALALGAWIADARWAALPIMAGNGQVQLGGLLLGAFVHAHLGAVLFRSHANPDIRRRHPIRFFVVPVVLLAAIVQVPVIAVVASVTATFWDVYHSGAQTFGLCRIYDRRAGNGAEVGRQLDFVMNQLVYAGPIVAGATLIDHLEDFAEFRAVGLDFFALVPVLATGARRPLTYATLVVALLFSAYYVWRYARLYREGHRFSVPKVFLLTSTALVSVVAWGFNSWGEAFFIMNFFHALQYFGIVWAFEKPNLRRLFHTQRQLMGDGLALGCFLSVAFGYGLLAEWLDPSAHFFYAVTLVMSLMHFWYDGFVWSVRRDDV